MIHRFDDGKISRKNGNKANSLIEMRQAGFNVPDGFVIDSDSFDGFINNNSLRQSINQDLSEKNGGGLSKLTLRQFSQAKFDDATLEQIDKLVSPRKKYAVRSSCTKEDMGDLSFAGQYETFLYVPKKEIVEKIIECYKATYNKNIVAYCQKNKISLKSLKMSVVVQEMVDPDCSGICFTVNPVSGNDKTMLIETARGIGENLVSGRKKPDEYLYNWYLDEVKYNKKNRMLKEDQVREYGKEFAEIQHHFGFPCDIEFAIKKDKLYILQARKITKIVYGDYHDIWSTADFKDGGVSATICTPYMWSLYEYIWDNILVKFIVDSKILPQKYLDEHVMGDMFFARCYWNLSVVKKAMSQVVGYREREFDSEYGIKGNYEGEGQTTSFTATALVKLARMAVAQKKIVSYREKNAERLKSELLEKYNDYVENFDEKKADIEAVWRTLVKDDYYFSESTYFWQIFINTIHQSLYKDSLLKYLSEDEYLTVLGGIKDISHLRPFYAMWDVSRKIRRNSKEKAFWQKNNPKTILKEISKQQSKIAKDVQKIIDDYGYHSDKELDVTYECYYENPLPYIVNIKNMVDLENQYGPERDQELNHRNYREILNRIKSTVSDKKYRKIEAKIQKMREMLWWREEFRDVSTRFYYIIHIYTIELAKELKRQGVLGAENDVWMLKIGDLWDYYDGKNSADDLSDLVRKNRFYYESYRNYMSDNEIVPGDSAGQSEEKAEITGLGACSGKVTATARVIKDFSEIGRLKQGEILVTKFTDTGWTPKFAIMSGIVTEYGGILCHAAIVSREYGIPAIVNCHDAMKKIKDGQTITIDGSTGEVKIEGRK